MIQNSSGKGVSVSSESTREDTICEFHIEKKRLGVLLGRGKTTNNAGGQ